MLADPAWDLKSEERTDLSRLAFLDLTVGQDRTTADCTDHTMAGCMDRTRMADCTDRTRMADCTAQAPVSGTVPASDAVPQSRCR